jgi:hypothetical protein
MRFRWLWIVPLLAVNCRESSTAIRPEATPAWLTQLILQLEATPVANPPARIVQYRYQGATVYYLPPRCCDIPSNLYSLAGDMICHPDGGFSGAGDARCPDFFAQAQFVREMWRDSRPRP